LKAFLKINTKVLVRMSVEVGCLSKWIFFII